MSLKGIIAVVERVSPKDAIATAATYVSTATGLVLNPQTLLNIVLSCPRH